MGVFTEEPFYFSFRPDSHDYEHHGDIFWYHISYPFGSIPTMATRLPFQNVPFDALGLRASHFLAHLPEASGIWLEFGKVFSSIPALCASQNGSLPPGLSPPCLHTIVLTESYAECCWQSALSAPGPWQWLPNSVMHAQEPHLSFTICIVSFFVFVLCPPPP